MRFGTGPRGPRRAYERDKLPDDILDILPTDLLDMVRVNLKRLEPPPYEGYEATHEDYVLYFVCRLCRVAMRWVGEEDRWTCPGCSFKLERDGALRIWDAWWFAIDRVRSAQDSRHRPTDPLLDPEDVQEGELLRRELMPSERPLPLWKRPLVGLLRTLLGTNKRAYGTKTSSTSKETERVRALAAESPEPDGS